MKFAFFKVIRGKTGISTANRHKIGHTAPNKFGYSVLYKEKTQVIRSATGQQVLISQNTGQHFKNTDQPAGGSCVLPSNFV